MKTVLFHINTYNIGGLCSCISTRYRALKSAGHEVSTYMLSNNVTQRDINSRESFKKKYEDIEGITNLDDQCWITESNAFYPNENQILINKDNNEQRGTTQLNGFEYYLELAEKTDLFIFIEPFFTGAKRNVGCKFVRLFTEAKKVNPNLKIVILCHDTRMTEGYPWIYPFIDKGYIDGIMCSHAAAYRMMSVFNVPRVLTLTPVDLPSNRNNILDDWRSREDTLFNLSFFKGWKRSDSIFRLAPFLPEYKTLVAGAGIEKAYMLSKDKIKPKYLWNPKDLGYNPNWEGKSIYQVATQEAFFKDLDWVDFKTRDRILKKVKFGIDPSYHTPKDKSFSKLPIEQSIRSHWNRVTIETMIQGAIPLVDEWGYSRNSDGSGIIFKAGINVVELPRTDDPRERAESIREASRLPVSKIQEMREANYRDVLPLFDKHQNAKWINYFYHYLKGNTLLDFGDNLGVYKNPEVGGNFYNINTNHLIERTKLLAERLQVMDDFKKYNLL